MSYDTIPYAQPYHPNQHLCTLLCTSITGTLLTAGIATSDRSIDIGAHPGNGFSNDRAIGLIIQRPGRRQWLHVVAANNIDLPVKPPVTSRSQITNDHQSEDDVLR